MFLNKIRNFCCVPNTKFVSATNVARAGKRGNIYVGNNVSATLCPRFPGPLGVKFKISDEHPRLFHMEVPTPPPPPPPGRTISPNKSLNVKLLFSRHCHRPKRSVCFNSVPDFLKPLIGTPLAQLKRSVLVGYFQKPPSSSSLIDTLHPTGFACTRFKILMRTQGVHNLAE